MQHEPLPLRRRLKRVNARRCAVAFALWLFSGACERVPTGNVFVTAVLSQELDIENAPDEADVILYLRDLAPIGGEKPGPWDAPVVDHHRVKLNTLHTREVAFTFTSVPAGEYAVFVLVDSGRPHVRPGSTNFPPRPGDFHGRTRQGVLVREGMTSPVEVEARIQVLLPEGYAAPLYLD